MHFPKYRARQNILERKIKDILQDSEENETAESHPHLLICNWYMHAHCWKSGSHVVVLFFMYSTESRFKAKNPHLNKCLHLPPN